jgi:hypothetical protein
MAGRRKPYRGGTRGVAGVSFRFEFQTAGKVRIRDPAARCARIFARNIRPKEEGAGKAGCALHPRSRVQNAHSKNAHEHTGPAEAIRPSPRNGFTAYFALSPATNSFCHRRLRIGICLSPVGPAYLRKLDISNGCQDHTTSPYAARLRQLHRRIVHSHRSFDQGGFSAVRLRAGRKLTSHKGSPCYSLCAPTLPRPPHPVPNVRDDRDTPLLRAGMGRACSGDLPDGERGIFSIWGLDSFS